LKGSLILRTLTLALLLVPAPSVFIPSTGRADPNGGARPVVTNATVGPYKMQVGIFPGQPRVGNLHLSIRVEDAAGEQVLIGAAVYASLAGPPGATSVDLVPATNTPQNPQTYDVDMPLDMIGSWTLTLETDSELGKASLELPLEVVEPEGFDLILLLAGGVAILALVLLIRDRIGNGRSQAGS